MHKTPQAFLHFFSLRNILLAILIGLIGYMFVYPRIAAYFYNYNREQTMQKLEQS